MARNHHQTHLGRRLDFYHHAYLKAIYADDARDVRIRAASQCGKSEYEITWAMSQCDEARRVFWVFPTDTLRNQFVQDRVDPTISVTPRYAAMAQTARSASRMGKDAPDATMLKHLGKGAIAFVGSNSEVSFKSFSADAAIIDELDQCDQANLMMVPDRMAASNHRQIRRIGNPTLSGYGIDLLYGKSDQRQWFISCVACGARQCVTWFGHVVREESEGVYALRSADGAARLMCEVCNHEMDRYADGEWVAAYPDREAHGYHISQIFSGEVTLPDLWDEFNEALSDQTRLQRFYNSVLGLPYTAPGAKLTIDVLSKRLGDHPRLSSYDGECYAGCDVGSLNHLTIENEAGYVILIEAVTWTRLDEVMQQFPRLTMVIDALPELNRCMEWAAKYPGRVFRSYVNKKTQRDEPFDLDYAAQETSAERTQMIDRAFARYFKAGAITLPRDAMSVQDFTAHMTAPSRILDLKRTPPVYIWTEGSAADHYAMSDVYRNWAREICAFGGGRVFFG